MSIDKKIEVWKNNLLDLGKRNKMINYKDTKRSSFSIKNPSLDELWNRLVENEETIEFPNYIEYSIDDDIEENENDYTENDYLVASQNKKELKRTLKKIKNDSKVFSEEKGINPLYIAFGFVNWKESENSDYVLHSPLVLVPITIDSEDIYSPYTMKIRDDEIIINPTLAYKFKNDFGIDISTDRNLNEDTVDINQYIEEIGRKVNKLNWTVDKNVSIALFSFYKISMYNDLEANKEKIEQSIIVQSLDGQVEALQEIPEELNDIDHDKNKKVEDTYQILDADSSQLDAIEYAKNGISFVLQGPPGTGKSQTIANMIAELMASGKKVLFVSSKMAALEVVHKRLTNAKLGDLCLSLHDPRANKKEVLNQLNDVLELSKKKYNLTDESKKKLIDLQLLKDEINEYKDELHKNREPFNKSVYQINGRIAKLDEIEEIMFKFGNIQGISEEQFTMLNNKLEKYIRTLNENSLCWKNNEWNGYKLNVVNNELRHDIRYYLDSLKGKLIKLEDEYRKLQNELKLNNDFKFVDKENLLDFLMEIEKDSDYTDYWFKTNDIDELITKAEEYKLVLAHLNIRCETINNNIINELKDRIEINVDNSDKNIGILSKYIEDNEFFKNLNTYNKSNIDEYLSNLKEYVKEYNELRNKLVSSYEEDIFSIDYNNIYNRFKTDYNGFLGKIKKSYREDKKVFLGCKREIAKKITDDEMIDTLQVLKEIDKLKSNEKYSKEAFSKIFKDYFKEYKTDVNTLEKIIQKYEKTCKCIELLKSNKEEIESINDTEASNIFQKLYVGINSDWEKIISKLKDFKKFKEKAEKLNIDNELLLDIYKNNKDKSIINKHIKDLNKSFNDIRQDYNWFNDLFDKEYDLDNIPLNKLKYKISYCVENIDTLEKYVDYKNAKRDCIEEGLEDFINTIESKEYKSEMIIPMFKKRFYRLWLDSIENNIPILSGFRKTEFEEKIKTFKRLDKEQLEISRFRILNKIIDGLPNLERLTKGNDEVSILKKELNKNKKIMPLRVLFKNIPNLIVALKPCIMMSPLSVSIFLDSSLYKFDTVIFDEASQIKTEDAIGAIIRGKQVIIVGDNKQLPPTNFFNVTATDSDEYDEDEEEYNDTNAYESILDEANLLPEKTLLWHYRSKDESLIAFSNAKFYKNKLITFPSISENVPDNGVEFFYVDNGTYDRGGRKGNVNEAKRVAELVFECLDKYPQRSLGVIAFGSVQQTAIENELTKLRMEKPEYEKYFDEEKTDSFFIKNLENVQGDERDTIIFSVGYAKDIHGNMNMNFGPLSRIGGERRLNVAVTRAKYNIKLVSSILASDINTEKVSTEGPKLLKRYIEYAQNGVSILENEVNVNEENYFDSPFEESVYEFLTSKGYKVKTQVGCSGYRIDMAIQSSTDNDKFIIGIECDGAMYHSTRTARERDRIRQTVLEDMGWKMYRIWSTDWIKNTQKEKEELIKAIENAKTHQDDDYNDSFNNGADEGNVIYAINEERNIDSENPYDLDYYKEFKFDYNEHTHRYPKYVLEEIIDTEYPIHFDEICKKSYFSYGYYNCSQEAKECVKRDLNSMVNTGEYICDRDFYMPKDAMIKPRINKRLITEDDCKYLDSYGLYSTSGIMKSMKYLPITRPIRKIYYKELALAMKKVYNKSVGIDIESLFKETAKTIGCANNAEYMLEAFKAIDDV